MRWPWRRTPQLPAAEPEENGTVEEIKEFARQARWRAQADRRRVERLAPRMADLPDEEFVARVAALLQMRYP